MSYSKKDEDGDQTIFKVDRSTVFQEARIFNTSPISPRKCRIQLTKITYLLHTGERFPTPEATTLFFGITKLFQHRDPSLRQMVYLVIKELASTAEDVIMVTASIMKDTAVGSDVVYRPNAIRALCRVIDATNVQAIERLIKTAIVDKTPSVSSAALVSSYHLLPLARDVVRRWANETQEAVLSNKSGGGFLGLGSSSSSIGPPTGYMTQYHAIGLLYQMRAHDRMSLVKMVQQFGSQNASAIKSPAAVMMLVRLAGKIAIEDPNLRKPMAQLLEGWLRHKSEMVNFEAAKVICELPDVTDAEVAPAVHVLQLFLTSPRAVTKFAAIRILHHIASFKPNTLQHCNMDIETLISNSNRSIATFAITTLLKTGNEASVDRLMKQISGFMADITDEFKITIVEAIRTLCLKFPSKQAGMLAFLSGILRDEGGYEFKKSVVESMFDLIKFVPDSKEEGKLFIEDCEFTKLAVRVLHLLGQEGPKTSHPTKYIRYIYNRVVLENAVVRAAAVTALAKFGVGQKDEEVKRSVVVLLTRCLDDPDDEVRDRAALNLKLVTGASEYGAKFIHNDSIFSLPIFEHQLVMYVTGDQSTFSKPFDIASIPVVTRAEADAEDKSKKMRPASDMPTLKAPTISAPGARPSAAPISEAAVNAAAASQQYAATLSAIPEIKALGQLLKSSRVVELTEAEMEYVVTSVKHIFKDHIVLQYNVKNTLTDSVLENVTVQVTVAEEDEEEPLVEEFYVPAPKIAVDSPGTIYVAFKRPQSEEGAGYTTTTFNNVLKFTTKEIDPSTGEAEDGGYDDEYEVEDLELTGGDYVVPAFCGNFGTVWEQVGTAGEEVTETYGLPQENVKNLEEACNLLASALSLQPMEGTDVPMSTTSHVLKLFGKTISGGRVVAMVKMVFSSKSGVTVKITVRSEESGVGQLVVSAVA
ncbi:hypothetical protein AOL_s00079g252 [Orbilia oligospora ATCC 24927]|uniref:Coatomer subunit gamma n=1 Tax=Arthrobotrys oligospora (strain ATCC 24927 / CBS 115.81 / DSM 1491) TaxID=756982 RepID=G1XCT2_ARTOA|nr:hypothetical protein AOL_s00079g252 [Orbilia oligospora ATCC 24927]EGX49031.1 hypothetical protein AOL_s00079g252 [Orbilia oligospora ATCC 24927]